MSKDHVEAIEEIVEFIRQSELKRGTVVRTETTLATCPADMDRIMHHVLALEEQLRDAITVSQREAKP